CKAFDLVLSCRDSAKQTSLLALAAPRFAPSGRKLLWPFVPRALPWAGCSLPLRGVPANVFIIPAELEMSRKSHTIFSVSTAAGRAFYSSFFIFHSSFFIIFNYQ
ncbi:MAG: hypothetical protein K6B45_09585, partial [Bacteroidaceae bacterium]|nr:hypothetical protein [Bacteroidaceae bacterium]